MTNIIAIAMAAILSVESQNGADKRTGDGGRAVGAFQMWPVAVQEANRVESIMARREGRRPRKWRVSDRVDIDWSMEMCEARCFGITDVALSVLLNWPVGGATHTRLAPSGTDGR